MRKRKYHALTKYLFEHEDSVCTLTFLQINKIIGSPLPQTAYIHANIFWTNTNQNYALIWLNAGYVIVRHDLKQQIAVFKRDFSKAKEYISRCKKQTEEEKDYSNPLRYVEKQTHYIEFKTLMEKAENYFEQINIDENARYLSWEHCYSFFSANHIKPDEETQDLLCLHLAWYLASWGMLRGGTFLLQKDYKVHIPVVKLLTSESYANLYSLTIDEMCDEKNAEQIMLLSDKIIEVYQQKTKSNDLNGGKTASDTLITKILLGTMGCVPAYDRYFKKGLSLSNVAQKTYNIRSILQLATYYAQNQNDFEELQNRLSDSRVKYPPMKILDMCFWQLGFEHSSKNEDLEE